MNPGDLRVAATIAACGGCHELESKNVARSMMTHGAMLGARRFTQRKLPLKDALWRSYSEAGGPQTLIQTPAPTADAPRTKGLLEFLDPTTLGNFASRATCCACSNAAASAA